MTFGQSFLHRSDNTHFFHMTYNIHVPQKVVCKSTFINHHSYYLCSIGQDFNESFLAGERLFESLQSVTNFHDFRPSQNRADSVRRLLAQYQWKWKLLEIIYITIA